MTDEGRKLRINAKDLRPVTGFTVAKVEEIALLLDVHYIESPDGLKAGGMRIKFALTAQQALSLSESLIKLANQLKIPRLVN